MQTLAGRKKQRTAVVRDGEAEQEKTNTNAEMDEDTPAPEVAQSEPVKAVLMELASLGAKLQELLRSMAPAQAT